MDEPSHGVRSGLMCALVVAFCLWVTYPVAEVGFIDDWSYVKTAQVFAQTGHFENDNTEVQIAQLKWLSTKSRRLQVRA